jgi:hypothetical protein
MKTRSLFKSSLLPVANQYWGFILGNIGCDPGFLA